MVKYVYNIDDCTDHEKKKKKMKQKETDKYTWLIYVQRFKWKY